MYHQHPVVPGVGSAPYYGAGGWNLAPGHGDSVSWQANSNSPQHYFQRQEKPEQQERQERKDAGEMRTTVMLRNLPEGFTRDMLTAVLNSEGFLSLYDFIYMPMNFRTKASFGYAFVNMVSPLDAERCHEKLEGFTRWGVPTSKVCVVS